MPAARVLWAVLVLLNLAWYLANLPPQHQQLLDTCEPTECTAFLPMLTRQEADQLSAIGLSIEFYAAFQIGTAVAVGVAMVALGILIAVRRWRDWLGLLASFSLIAFGTSGQWPLAGISPVLAALAWVLDSLAVASLVLLFFLFPDGRAVPRWTRYAVALVVALTVFALLPLTFVPQVRSRLVTGGGDLIIVGFLAVGLLAQIRRYRGHSNAIQRQQTKWVLFGLAGTTTAYLLWVLILVIFPPDRGTSWLYWNLVGGTTLVLLFTSLPVSLAISILRYRLLDIDILIKRTVVYSALTLAIVATYFAAVVALQGAFRGLIGQANQLAIVASTLLIAALFNPLRQRIQTAVNRRFYRSDYDAARALATFAGSVQDEVDIERIQAALLSATQDTMRPESVSLWLRETRRL